MFAVERTRFDSEIVKTFPFPNPVFLPMVKNHFREVEVYLKDRTGAEIPFEHGEVNAELTLRPVSTLSRV